MRTDLELVEAFRAGDERAFEELLRRHRGMTHQVAGRYYAVGWAHEDLVLEAEVGVWEAALGWSGRGVFASWAAFVAQRKVITFVKASSRQRCRPLRTFSDIFSPEVAVDVEAGLGGVMADPADALLLEERRQERRRQAWEVIADLGLTDLEAAAIAGWAEGRARAEVAQAAGVTYKSADNAMQRVRRKVEAY